jgi:hypothetical protein
MLIIFTIRAQSNSVFLEDTCAPPCWMGLIPGESTAENVENLIAERAIDNINVFGEFDEATRHLINGVYEITFLVRDTSTVFTEIRIRDSLVDTIVVHPTTPDRFPDTTLPDEYITLQQTLTRLGQPDIIYFDRDELLYYYHSNPHLTFIYLISQLRIEFHSPVQGCWMQSIGDDMVINTLTYYSPNAAKALSSHVGHDEPQPALTALHLGEEIVTPNVWQQVINSELEEPCRLMPTLSDNSITTPIIYDEPRVPRSLFAEDSCAPPCWMGLTPGESTSQDVAYIIQNTKAIFREWIAYDDSIFNEQTGLIVSGGYRSEWILLNRDDVAVLYGGASFFVRDGMVEGVRVLPNQTILLHDVQMRLGTPDFVLINWHEVTGSNLYLIYYDLRIHIYLDSTRHCNVERMSNNFWVSELEYYSPASIQQVQAHIIQYGGTVVPIELWQRWVSGEETRSCQTVWNELAESR